MVGVIRGLLARVAPLHVALLVAALSVLVADVVVLATSSSGGGDRQVAAEESARAMPFDRRATTTTEAPATTTTAPAPPSSTAATPAPPATEPPPVDTTAAPTSTAPTAPTKVGPAAATGTWSLDPYRGLGAWVDVYDWTVEMTGGAPTVSLDQIDAMAASGVQTLYLQTSHRKSGADIMEHQRQLDLINRAKAHGMYVVGWYLPMLEDVDLDLRRLVAAAERLPLDGIGVDIESLAVGDVAERNRRLLDLSTRLRSALGPNRAISAITPSAVHVQEVNPAFWPDFPWPQIATIYDVIQPMAYWSVRRPEWRDATRYIGENIDRIRIATGRLDMPVHPVGGIADGIGVPEVEAMLHASTARGVLGLSLYDWRTSNPAQWAALAPIRR